MLSYEDSLQEKNKNIYKKLNSQILEDIADLRDEHNLFMKNYNVYFDRCKQAVEGIDNIAEDFKIDVDIVLSEVLNVFEEETNSSLKLIDKEYETKSKKISALNQRCYDHFKSRIKYESICFEDYNNKLQSYRVCMLPSFSDADQMIFPHLYDFNRREISPREMTAASVKKKYLLNLKLKLSTAVKSIIKYAGDETVQQAVLKYNNRKEEHIKHLRDLFSAYENLGKLKINKEMYEKANEELELSYFQFKETHGFENIFPDIRCTYFEKKEKIKTFLKKVDNFLSSFFNSVLEVKKLQYSSEIFDLKMTLSTESISPNKTYNKILNCIKIHTSNKKGCSEEEEQMQTKFIWSKSSMSNKKALLKKMSSFSINRTLDQTTETVRFDGDQWKKKIFQSFPKLVCTQKSKMDCEKKFNDVRLSMMCTELDSFKVSLAEEMKCIKAIEKFQKNVQNEENEFDVIESEITLLKDRRLHDKKRLKELHNEFLEIVEENRQFEEYLKSVFKMKTSHSFIDTNEQVLSDYTSSDSSESEQISDVENHKQNAKKIVDVENGLLDKIIGLCKQKGEIEANMVEYKRNIILAKNKQSIITRKIYKLNDSMAEMTDTLNFILALRKEKWTSFKWPLVLYPGNMHSDCICDIDAGYESHFVESEMNDVIQKQLTITNNYVKASVFFLIQEVASAEVSDIIDCVYVLIPLIHKISESTDKYFKTVYSSDLPTSSASEQKDDFNFVRNVLETTGLLSLEDSAESFRENSKTISYKDFSEKEEQQLSEQSDDDDILDLKRDIMLRTDINQPFNEREDIFDSEKDDLKCDLINSSAIAAIDYCVLLQQNFSNTIDYYMHPLSLNSAYMEDIPSEKELNINNLVDNDVSEIVEHVLRKIDEKITQISDLTDFPTHPGGGLKLTWDVLRKIQMEDPDLFPYSDFYEKIDVYKSSHFKAKRVHILPCRQEEFSLQSSVGFIAVDSSYINKMYFCVYFYHGIKTSIAELQHRLSTSKKILCKCKRELNLKHEVVTKKQRQFDKDMLAKFSCIVDVNNLLDEVENPLFLIRKKEVENKIESLRKKLIEAKSLETASMRFHDDLCYEDTKVCFELSELRSELKSLNEHFRTKREVLPKIASTSSFRKNSLSNSN